MLKTKPQRQRLQVEVDPLTEDDPTTANWISLRVHHVGTLQLEGCGSTSITA